MRPVDHIHNFHSVRVFQNPVDDDERERRQRQFPRILYAATPPSTWKRSEHAADAVVNLLSDALRLGGIVPADVINDGFKGVRGFRCPTNLHLRLELLLEAHTHFLVSEKLTAIKLRQALRNLPPEPCIVVDVAFNKLLHVLIRAAPVLRRYAFELRLQFRGEVNFHRF